MNRTLKGKQLGLRRGIRVESRKIQRLAAVELEIIRSSIQRM